MVRASSFAPTIRTGAHRYPLPLRRPANLRMRNRAPPTVSVQVTAREAIQPRDRLMSNQNAVIATATLFVPVHIDHPLAMVLFLIGISAGFCLFGFAIGVWAQNFEQLQIIPMLIITPLTFLGGSFYSVNMLPSGWRTITLLNPVVYLISGFRWSFYEIADVSVALSLGMTVGFLAICMALVWWIFRTGYRMKN